MDTKEEEDNQTDIVVVFKPEKQFPCEMCVKTFSRKDSLKRHLKICKKGIRNIANLQCVNIFSTCSNRIKHEKNINCIKNTNNVVFEFLFITINFIILNVIKVYKTNLVFCNILLFPSKATSSQPASNQFMDEVDPIEEWCDRFYEYQ